MRSSAAQAPAEPSRDASLARRLVRQSEPLASAWRRDHCGDRDPLLALPQLDNLVESLIEELGRSLDNPADLPAAPWGRISGVFRISAAQGATGLCWEFSVLRALLSEAAQDAGADATEVRRLHTFLDAIQHQALALQAYRIEPGSPRPAVAFGGVVVEAA